MGDKVPYKGKTTYDAGYWYAPHIPTGITDLKDPYFIEYNADDDSYIIRTIDKDGEVLEESVSPTEWTYITVSGWKDDKELIEDYDEFHSIIMETKLYKSMADNIRKEADMEIIKQLTEIAKIENEQKED